MRVLIVEDSRALRESLRLGLGREGFAVDVAETGTAGRELACRNPYDLIVLDWMLPGMDGIEVLGELEALDARPHVLLLTARDAVADRIHGLDAGADDYLTKPFEFDELLARLRALTRRRYAAATPWLEVGELRLDPAGKRVEMHGRAVELTARLFGLLHYLMLRRGRVASRIEIEDHIYGAHELPESNAVDSAIYQLRSALGAEGRRWIRTKRGQGYLLDRPEA